MYSTLVLALTLVVSTNAHMTIFHPSMYGVGWAQGNNGSSFSQQAGDFSYNAGAPTDPIGPGIGQQSDWWFHGPNYRRLPPLPGQVANLPAGGKFTFEIACHVAWTSYGVSTTVPGSNLDACPGNSGAYHSGDPNSNYVDMNLLSGCALGIADVDDINKVTMDNLVIFSTQQKCVAQRYTDFEIPALMPACTGSKCICGWFWLANNGTANFYMTAFDCKITNVSPNALKIAPPSDPVWCAKDNQTCLNNMPTGSKRPLYAYNNPSNVDFTNNYDRPGYHANWGFPINGAQNDIFHTLSYGTGSTPVSTTVSITSTTSASSTTSTPTSSATTTSAPTSTTSTTTTTTTSSSSAIPQPTGAVINLARSGASASASSSNLLTGSTPDKAIDGITRGAPTDPGALDLGTILSGAAGTEWATFQQSKGATFTLGWSNPVTFNQIVLYDRPNPTDQITSAIITFADGSSIPISTLNNDGTATYFNTSTITTKSLTMTVLSTSPSTANVGLAEIQIFFTPTTGFTDVLTPTPKSAKRSVISSPRHARDFSRRDEIEEKMLKDAAGSDLVERKLFAE